MNQQTVTLTPFHKEFLEKIIRVPSVGGTPEKNAPYGEAVRKVLDLFLTEAKKYGFKTGVIGNRVGWVEFGTGEKLIGIICHLDVVPVADGWSSDPFTLTFRKDETDSVVMVARGIVDDKGPACAGFFAMKGLLDENRIPKNCRVRLILGTDEERTCSCIQYYAAHGEIPDLAITPDSVFPVIFSEKRILQLRIFGENDAGLEAHGGSAVNIVPANAYCVVDGKKIKTAGIAAHASKPELGVNAIELLPCAMVKQRIDISDYPMMKFVKDFSKAEFTRSKENDEYWNLTCNLGILNMDNEGCELRIDFRVPAEANADVLIQAIEKKASAYGLQTEVTLNLPPLLIPKDSEEIRNLTDIWERHMDQFSGFQEEYRKIHIEPKAVGVGTYARHIPNTVAFGIQAPWQIDQCHQTNEHVTVNDFLQWVEILREFIIMNECKYSQYAERTAGSNKKC